DPTAYMVFGGERDMAGFAERAPLKAAPGTWWNYTNGNTLLLSRIIRDSAGGNATGVLAFAHRELFDKLGMRHVTPEFDSTGMPADAFMARGSGGQYTIIVPSHRLVIVRMGPAFTSRDDMDVVARLIADVTATLPKS